MPESGFAIKNANIAVIGLGLMGGSLALSLKGKAAKLRAYDPDIHTLELAQKRDIVHLASSDPLEALEGADLIVLSCPVFDILDWIKRLPDYVQKPCIVLDLGSTKRMIVEALAELPEKFDPIGGHAICGSERLSLENASPSLCRDAPFVLTPLPRTSENARAAALQIVDGLGAFPVWLAAEEHDRVLAYTSHLPFLLSSALALSTPEEAATLVGPGFRSSSRLAGTPPSMMLDVVLSNRENILESIQHLQKQLTVMESALMRNESPSLKTVLDTAQKKYLWFTR